MPQVQIGAKEGTAIVTTAAIPAADTRNTDWVQSAIDSIGCRKDDPEYLKELFDDAKEARRRIDEEFLRELDRRDVK